MTRHHEWLLDDDIIHLNHAAVAPWPRRTRDAVIAFAEENSRQGSRDYARWLRLEQALREQFRQLLNAESRDDIALVKNTSEGLSLIAHGLGWREGDNIVISNEEFPSNRIVWESLAPLGVTVRQADLARGETPEQALIDACDRDTRLLAISSVQYASGLRMDLDRLGEYCRQRGILFCIDAIQSLGVLPFDVQAHRADFVAADGHKWLLGPEGLAVFYVRPELREQLRLHQFGWHMVEACGDFDRRDWQIARSARRFECGSPNMLGIVALHASLSLLLEVGIERVASQVRERVEFLLQQIEAAPQLKPAQRRPLARYAGIVAFRHVKIDSQTLHSHLDAQGVLCAVRNQAVRFSPHYYTPMDKLAQAVSLAINADEIAAYC